jgi:putative spermidine/putrescine transport system ATP-binding protein
LSRAASPIAEFLGVSKCFGSARAVDDVSFAIERGEFFSLLGPSGCGKTTTLRLLAGLENPDAGDIRLGGASALALRPYERKLGMVFQSYALFPHLSVGRNVGFGLERRRVPAAEAARRVAEALHLVRLDAKEFGPRRPAQLSGGQRQRVALARALVLEPDLLLLDEPLGAIDEKLRRDMQLELRQLNRALGVTFIYVTHDQDEALTMSDRIAVMDAGRIAQLGTPAEIYERPRTEFVATFIGESNLFAGEGGRQLSVRPERMSIAPDGGSLPAGHTARAGRVEEVIYQGEMLRVLVRIAPAHRCIVALRNDSSLPRPLPWSTGAPVQIGWDPADARVLER